MPQAPDTTGERYVALGDSYTIGEGVQAEHAWSSLLTTHLRQQGVTIDLVANPSVSGWTTRQVIEHELPVLEESRPTFVTLLIGVNDWVQGVPQADFEERLAHILDRTQVALPDPRKVILVTIPDFSVSPEGHTYGRGRDIASGISTFNDTIKAQAALRSIPVVDIFPLSQELDGAEFIGEDHLHPSAAAYARWEQLIYPAALSLMDQSRHTEHVQTG